MNGLRSVTIGTNDMNETKKLFHDILGLNYQDKGEGVRFGDTNLASGTRLHFMEIPNYDSSVVHIDSIGLRVPTDESLNEYQTILKQNDITYGDITELNGNKHFSFKDHNGQRFDIYSNEQNTGTPLGTPSFDSPVHPLHQIQGLGPVILKVNQLVLTISVLSQVLGLEHFAQYSPSSKVTDNIQVFKIGDGGLGGELHLYNADETIQVPEHGLVEQVEFATDDVKQYQNALEQLETIGMPYQRLKQDDSQSVRINENSGISFILTSEQS
ncbi:VOC family protein [Staphylococcus auricularis]|uniref:VOC family protein n=1 Tax=Staphylococcus auricularis TaxID=29379 RepID=UPI00242F079E|nr:VOC family protein [Staphylococcus auricularis]